MGKGVESGSGRGQGVNSVKSIINKKKLANRDEFVGLMVCWNAQLTLEFSDNHPCDGQQFQTCTTERGTLKMYSRSFSFEVR